jgi:hypothetical protein
LGARGKIRILRPRLASARGEIEDLRPFIWDFCKKIRGARGESPCRPPLLRHCHYLRINIKTSSQKVQAKIKYFDRIFLAFQKNLITLILINLFRYLNPSHI